MQLTIAVGRAYRALERGVRPQLSERGLGLSEYAVLEVRDHNGPLTLGEIRDRTLVTGVGPCRQEARGTWPGAAGSRRTRPADRPSAS